MTEPNDKLLVQQVAEAEAQRQASFGYEPSIEDYIIAGIAKGEQMERERIADYSDPSIVEKTVKVICLCGSTRFIKEFQDQYGRLTDEGYIVLTVGRVVPQHEQPCERKAKLDELHLRKIDLADEVLVLNIGGYIGESTRNEINYAESKGKPVMYLERLVG